MNYYLDTKFIENPGFIQLISIGIVSESGNEYYAISAEYDESKASDWVKKNVIAKLEPESIVPRKTNIVIRQEIIEFLEDVGDLKYFHNYPDSPYFSRNDEEDKKKEKRWTVIKEDDIVFWAYFADYDWVVFCWLFGTMMDLPKGMPMYCRDLKQEMDIAKFPEEQKPKPMINRVLAETYLDKKIAEGGMIIDAVGDLEDYKIKLRRTKEYKDLLVLEHNALGDAKWNRLLHKSLITFEEQKKAEGLMEEWEDLAQEMQSALKSYEIQYNRKNEHAKIELSLKLNQQKTPSDPKLFGRAALILQLKNVGGSAYILANKTFGHHTEVQYNAKFDWALLLYREMLMEMIGAGIVLNQINIKANEAQRLGFPDFQ